MGWNDLKWVALGATIVFLLATCQADAFTCEVEEDRKQCFYAEGEHVFADADSFSRFLDENGLIPFASGQTTTVPNELNMPLGTKLWIYVNPEQNKVVSFARRPGKGLELVAITEILGEAI